MKNRRLARKKKMMMKEIEKMEKRTDKRALYVCITDTSQLNIVL